jgi:hypothetical protein
MFLSLILYVELFVKVKFIGSISFWLQLELHCCDVFLPFLPFLICMMLMFGELSIVVGKWCCETMML